jgi:hypothetical protein
MVNNGLAECDRWVFCYPDRASSEADRNLSSFTLFFIEYPAAVLWDAPPQFDFFPWLLFTFIHHVVVE